MVKTIKGKLLLGIILSVILINVVFTAFIAIFLDNNLKNSIIDEITNINSYGITTIKQNELIGESKWKSLNEIKLLTKSYVSLVNDDAIEYVSTAINEAAINNILSESNNLKSLIKFENINNIYCVTYNYPIYIDESFYGNLIIQKDYTEKYNKNLNTIQIIVVGQVLLVLTLIVVVSIIINKITKPINILSSSMSSISNNISDEQAVLTANIDNDSNDYSNDEIGTLAKSYNSMRTQIKEQMELILSEKEKVEILERKSREFFNNATHELKTPITAISLYSQILNDIDLNDIDKEFFHRSTERIILESEKMKLLVEKILDVSKGDMTVNKLKSVFSLDELLEDIIEDYEFRAVKNNFIINLNLEKTTINCNLEDIEQVIINLLENSFKYSVNKVININLYQCENKILFEISNKCGHFPDEIKSRLLEPFIKYNKFVNQSKGVSSSGLGLYLCNELVKDNGGVLSYSIEDNVISFACTWKFPGPDGSRNLDT